MNGYGFGDFVVGRWYFLVPNVILFFGSPTGPEEGPRYTFPGSAGASFAALGDVDGDGFDDLAVSVVGGAALVHRGSSTGLVATPSFSVTAPDEMPRRRQFARKLGAGDFDGDGRTDLVVSDYWDEFEPLLSRVYVQRGTAVSPWFSATPVVINDPRGVGETRFGIAVAAVDLDGNGYDDLAVGAPVDGPAPPSGTVRVWHGSATGLDTGATPRAVTMPHPSGCFAVSLAPAGDANVDGVDDVFVGATQAPEFAIRAGRVWLMLGAAPGAPFTTPLNRSGPVGGELGWSIGGQP